MNAATEGTAPVPALKQHEHQGPSLPTLPRTAWRDIPRAYIVAFAIGTALIASLTWYHIKKEERTARAYWEARVASNADERFWVVSNYLDDRRDDAEVLAALPIVETLLSDQPKIGHVPLPRLELQRQLTDFLDAFIAVYGYPGVYLLDPEGLPVAQSTSSARLGSQGTDFCRTVARTGMFRVDLVPGKSLLRFSMPVFAESGARPATNVSRPVIGVVTLLSDPAKGLFPHLTAEGVPTRTAETVLLRRQGSEVLYFSPLRNPPSADANLHRSVDQLDLAAHAALDGRETFGEFIDYRGVRVLAATRRIPLTDWGLVCKIDREEALADFQHTERLEALAAGLVILGFAGLLIGHRRHLVARALKEQLERQQAILNLKESAQEIVDSVPAGLLVLSDDLRVLSANRPFLEAFHLRRQDVVGRALHEVIQAKDLPHRVSDVTQGRVTSHDVLLDLAMPGREEPWPARINITDIVRGEEEEGRLLLIIEDLTESERLRVAAQASEQRLRELVQSLDAIVWEANAITDQITFVSQRAEQILGYPVEQWLTEPDFLVSHLHPDDRERAVAVRRAATSQGKDYELEYRVKAADGRLVWLRDKVRVFRDVEGRVQQLRGVTVDVTGRKRAEEALRESEAKYRVLAEHIPAVTYIAALDEVSSKLYVSPQIESLLGYSPAEWRGDPNLYYRQLHPDDRERVLAQLAHSRASGEPFASEYRLLARDGSPRWFRDEAVVMWDSSGKPKSLHGVMIDMTERKRAEEALRASEERYRELFEDANDIVFTVDLAGNFTSVNKAGEQITGYTRDEAPKTNFAQIVAPEHLRLARQMIQRKLAEGGATRYELEIVAKDGRRVALEVSTRLIYHNGKPVGVQGIARDITERKRAEEALCESQERFRLLAEHIPGAIYLCKNDERYTMQYISDAVEKLTGYPKQDFLQDKVSFTELYHPSDVAAIQDEVKQAIAEQRPVHLTYRLKHRSGDWRWIEEIGAPIYHGSELRYWEGFLSDITERKRAEEVVLEWENRCEAAVQASGQVLYEWDLRTNEVTYGGSLEKTLGYSKQEMAGGLDRWLEIVHPEDREVFNKEVARVIATKEPFHLEYRVRRKDGSYIITKDEGCFALDPAGTIVRIVGFVADVTEQRRLEEQLRQVQRMQAAGL